MDYRYESSMALSNPKGATLSADINKWMTSQEPKLDVRDRYVQRSVSLKLDSRPNNRLPGGKDRDIRDINGNFELAHLLERASSWDTKLMKELQEEEQNGSELNLENLPDWTSFLSRQETGVKKEEASGSSHSLSEKVNLPLRYAHILARRRATRTPQGLSPTSPTSSLLLHCGGSVSGDSVSSNHKLDVLPEDPDDQGSEFQDAGASEVALRYPRIPQNGPEKLSENEKQTISHEEGQSLHNTRPNILGLNENVNKSQSIPSSFDSSLAARQKDAKAAMLWIHQEIRHMKQQDRALLRSLLELGSQMHRLSGMESCQSMTDHIDHDPGLSPGRGEGDQDSLEDILTTSLISINVHPATPRKPIGPLSFNSVDHFFNQKT